LYSTLIPPAALPRAQPPQDPAQRTACETAHWPAGTFWSAYCANLDEAVEGVIDADPIATAVCAVMSTRTKWTGTASDLLGALAGAAGERVAKSKTWPFTVAKGTGQLRQRGIVLAPGQFAFEISRRRKPTSTLFWAVCGPIQHLDAHRLRPGLALELERLALGRIEVRSLADFDSDRQAGGRRTHLVVVGYFG
jgi:hypothetical protein